MYQEFQNLIDDFCKLPKYKTHDETFISICGYPHYERVVTNILAFFFDTNREHNLRNLFAKSLILSANESIENFSGDFSSETEVRTDKGNFIDLLLRNDDRNIVIENKIFASLYNDLEDYYKKAEEKDKKEPLGMVLSLNDLKPTSENFKLVTYENFIKHLKKQVGDYIQAANKKYIPFLFDFIENIENLYKEPEMDNQFIEFLEKNKSSVDNFMERISDTKKDFRTKVKSISEKLKKKEIIKKLISQEKINIWNYRESNKISDKVVVDIYFQEKQIDIAFDSILAPSGWTFSIFTRKGDTSQKKLKEHLEEKNIDIKDSDESLELKKGFSFQESEENVVEFISDVTQKICDFNPTDN